ISPPPMVELTHCLTKQNSTSASCDDYTHGPTFREIVATAKEAPMKIFTSRYVHIGLALIIAVLLIAGVSKSASAAGPVYHTVQPGQTLYSIAQFYGTSVWAISCANGLYNPNYVY